MDSDHGKDNGTQKPLSCRHDPQSKFIHDHSRHASSCKCHRHKIGRHQKPRKFQDRFHHLPGQRHALHHGRHQKGKHQQIGNKKSCLRDLAAGKDRGKIRKHGPHTAQHQNLSQETAASGDLGKQRFFQALCRLPAQACQVPVCQKSHDRFYGQACTRLLTVEKPVDSGKIKILQARQSLLSVSGPRPDRPGSQEKEQQKDCQTDPEDPGSRVSSSRHTPPLPHHLPEFFLTHDRNPFIVSIRASRTGMLTASMDSFPKISI